MYSLKMKVNNVLSSQLLEQINIPCLCKVSDYLEIIILSDYHNLILISEYYDYNEWSIRCPCLAGGEYLFYNFGLITVKKSEVGEYFIYNLSLFDNYVGWCPIITDMKYANPNPLISGDIDPYDEV